MIFDSTIITLYYTFMSPAQTIQTEKVGTSLVEKGMALSKRIPLKGKAFLASFGAVALTLSVLALIAFPFFASETILKEIGGFIVNIVASFIAFVIAVAITITAVGILAIGFGYPPSKWNLSEYKGKALDLISRARVYFSTLRSAK